MKPQVTDKDVLQATLAPKRFTDQGKQLSSGFNWPVQMTTRGLDIRTKREVLLSKL